MRRQSLKDARNHTIGYIDTAADSRQSAKNARLHTVGYYDPHTNTTRDARFHVVGQGNLLALLINGS